MSTTTTRLGLKKPDGTDTFTRVAYNENLDIMDANAAKKADLDSLQAQVTSQQGGTNGTIREQIPYILETDTRSTTFTYTGGVLTNVKVKDGATVISDVTLTYTSGKLTQIAEVANGKTITTTLTYDGAGVLTDITKGVA